VFAIERFSAIVDRRIQLFEIAFARLVVSD
jgi:hypothetical protein